MFDVWKGEKKERCKKQEGGRDTASPINILVAEGGTLLRGFFLCSFALLQVWSEQNTLMNDRRNTKSKTFKTVYLLIEAMNKNVTPPKCQADAETRTHRPCGTEFRASMLTFAYW